MTKCRAAVDLKSPVEGGSHRSWVGGLTFRMEAIASSPELIRDLTEVGAHSR